MRNPPGTGQRARAARSEGDYPGRGAPTRPRGPPSAQRCECRDRTFAKPVPDGREIRARPGWASAPVAGPVRAYLRPSRTVHPARPMSGTRRASRETRRAASTSDRVVPPQVARPAVRVDEDAVDDPGPRPCEPRNRLGPVGAHVTGRSHTGEAGAVPCLEP